MNNVTFPNASPAGWAIVDYALYYDDIANSAITDGNSLLNLPFNPQVGNRSLRWNHLSLRQHRIVSLNHTRRAANFQANTHPLIRLFAQEETNKRAQKLTARPVRSSVPAQLLSTMVGGFLALTELTTV
jgi:hypothetical protein